MFFGLSWKENQVSSSFGDLIPVAIGNNLPILIASKCWNHGNLEFHFHSPRDCCHRKDIKPIYAFLAVDSWFYLSFSNSKIWQLLYLTIAIAFTSFKHCGKIFSHHQVISAVGIIIPPFSIGGQNLFYLFVRNVFFTHSPETNSLSSSLFPHPRTLEKKLNTPGFLY